MHKGSSVFPRQDERRDRFEEDRLKTVSIILNSLSQGYSFDLASFFYGYILADMDIAAHLNQAQEIKRKLQNLKEMQESDNISLESMACIIYDGIIDSKKDKTLAQKAKNTKIINTIQRNFEEIFEDPNYIIHKWTDESRRLQEELLNERKLKEMLQHEERQNLSRAQQQESKGWECQICNTDIDPSSMGILQCGHILHPECINAYLKAEIESNRVNVKCPIEECGRQMQTSDICRYIDGQLQQKYDKFTFNQFVESNTSCTSWCPTAGCPAVFQFDELLKDYRCPACQRHYCLTCRCDYHVGMTCAEYRITNSFDPNDQKFINFVKGAKFKQCPKCLYWVERNQGCPTMTCKCGQQFCYDCGGTGCPHGSCSGSGRKQEKPASGGLLGLLGIRR